MKIIFSLLLSILLIGASMNGRAEMLPPDELIRNTVQVLLELIKQDERAPEASKKKLVEYIDVKVLPHFDFERMTKLAVGRAWRSATPEQKTLLIAEFRTLLVRTYIKAITSSNVVSIETRPIVIPAGETEVSVKTKIIRVAAPPLLVNYDMGQTANGWKMFDLTVEGISLVVTHRGSFAEKVQQTGIDGLIKSLSELNNVPTSAAPKKVKAN